MYRDLGVCKILRNVKIIHELYYSLPVSAVD